VTTRQAAQKVPMLSATGALALLLLGSALASTESPAPCLDLAKYAETSVHAILDNASVASSTVHTTDSSEAVSPTPVADTTTRPADESPDAPVDADLTVIGHKAIPEISTRLPGVSASDLPRFRRHMFRTDI
jgi:hypothetical protein